MKARKCDACGNYMDRKPRLIATLGTDKYKYAIRFKPRLIASWNDEFNKDLCVVCLVEAVHCGEWVK